MNEPWLEDRLQDVDQSMVYNAVPKLTHANPSSLWVPQNECLERCRLVRFGAKLTHKGTQVQPPVFVKILDVQVG